MLGRQKTFVPLRIPGGVDPRSDPELKTLPFISTGTLRPELQLLYRSIAQIDFVQQRAGIGDAQSADDPGGIGRPGQCTGHWIRSHALLCAAGGGIEQHQFAGDVCLSATRRAAAYESDLVAARRPRGMRVISGAGRDLFRYSAFDRHLPNAAEEAECQTGAIRRPGWIGGAPGYVLSSRGA